MPAFQALVSTTLQMPTNVQNSYSNTATLHSSHSNKITTEKAVTPPWLNLNYNDIEGEIWKELPHLEGYYLISNFGRIKSLDRHIDSKDGKTRFYKGRILKGVVVKYKNNTVGDYIEEIKVGIFYCGNYCNIRVARMVYNLFVEELNYKQDGWVVTHKDGNRLNSDVNNLFLETQSQKQTKIISAGRSIKLHTYQTKEGYQKAATARYKHITQYSLQGYPIKTYQSIQEAAKSVGIGDSSIIKATQHKTMVSAGGFLWQYGCAVSKIDATFYTNFLKKSKQVKGIPVVQLSSDLLVFNYYKSINEAAKKTGIHPTQIANAVKNKGQLAGNFSWQQCNWFNV